MKDRKMLLIIVGVLVVALVVVFFFFINRKGPAVEEERGNVLPKKENLPKIDSSVKVDVKKTPDGRKVVLSIDNIPAGVDDIEYEFSYNTNEGVPRGVLGTIQVNGPSYEKEIVLGSCSTNVCTYDEGVEKVKVFLKFNSSAGAKIFEKEFVLNTGVGIQE